ncbi:serine--tRNA ligase [Gammaproteobacteria bacterium]|nr:serine--tRNA ligase [Gammaproteobacteria bacterium]
MLDIKLLRSDPVEIRDKLTIKGFELDVERFVGLDAERRVAQEEMESLQNERNVKSKAIGKAKSQGESADELIQEVGDLGQKLEKAKVRLGEVRKSLDALLHEIPNVPDDSVPEGLNEDSNLETKRFGEPKVFEFDPKDHVDLTEAGHLDFERAAKISGSRYVVMTGQLSRLHRALTQFMLDEHSTNHGYEEVYVPYIVNEQSLFGTGQLPKFEQDLFRIEGETPTYLTSTAEVPVTNIYRDEILDESSLPIKHVCHTPCFRSEAGSYGKDTRGMIRQHQFEKVELVQIVHPKDSWDALDALTADAERILEKLGLAYRSVVLCGGDLGFSSAKTVDLEVWLPGQGKYREISSCSNFLDFQARRLQTRFRDKASGKPELVHTLNGSGLAVGRTLVAILENYQDADGNIHLPEILRPYMGGVSLLELSD